MAADEGKVVAFPFFFPRFQGSAMWKQRAESLLAHTEWEQSWQRAEKNMLLVLNRPKSAWVTGSNPALTQYMEQGSDTASSEEIRIIICPRRWFVLHVRL